MLRLLASVSCVVAVSLAAPQDVYPPGLDPVSCPNFPYCGPTPAEIPNVSSNECAWILQQILIFSIKGKELSGPK